MRHLTSRFAMLVATAAVIPLLVYGLVSIHTLRQGTRRTVTEGNLNVAARAAEQMHRYLATNVKILQSLTTDLRNTELELWQQDRILKNYVLRFPEYRQITLFGNDGTALVSSRVKLPHPRTPQPLGQEFQGAYLSPVFVDNDMLPTMVISIKMTHLDRATGWLIGEFSLEELWRMVDRIRIGAHGFALVVADGGQLIAHGDPDEKRRVARAENLANHSLVRAAQAQAASTPVSAEYPTSNGLTLGVAAPLPSLNWTVIVEQPTGEAYANATVLQRQLMIVIAFVTLIMILVGYLWGRSFLRPISALMRGTRALAEGRLDERVDIKSGDEFQQLGDAFNSMAKRLTALQDDVRRKERQAIFGRIAVGLVHDLSHPIQNIGNNCRLILKMFDDPEYREMFRRTVERELTTMRRVLDDLKNVARPMPMQRFPVEVNRSVLEIVEAMRLEAQDAGVTIETKLTAQPLYVDADVFALGRVYRNLILNAVQATPTGGRVTIATEQLDDKVRILVSDTGSGISTDRLASIFDDFVTTKHRGLGMGLAVAKRIIEQLDGTIAVRSEVGSGTTFQLQFQVATAQRMEAEAVS